ncbi:MAG: metallophosphoesterase [Verrucomicrobiaceae bacterium]|nr:MAG: metallophosphoesterase [Verrucomicrobiaceae bacterium]
MTRILHLSDPHFGAMDLSASEAFQAKAGEMKPDLTILSGDLTMRARRGELAAASAFVDRLPKPLLMIPGNHDIPSINQPLDRFFNPFARYRGTFGDDLEPELKLGGIHVVSLNSSRAFGFHADWSEGRLSRKQLAAMREKFLASPTDELRILVLHHPLLELKLPGREVVKPLKLLMQTVEEARVDLVMCGHFHLSQIHPAGLTANWRAVISQAPTVCSTRLQGEPQGFHEILREGERMDTVHHVFKEGSFHPADRCHFSRGPAGWNHAAD